VNAIVYYDLTRVLSKASAPTPTGIDRVDIRYAKHFLDNETYKVVFVYTSKSLFKIAEFEISEKLVSMVYAKWIMGETLNKSDASWLANKAPQLLEKTGGVKRRLGQVGGGNEKALRSVDEELLDVLVKNRERKSCYFNTSHYGVGNDSSVQAYYVFKVVGGAGIVFYLHDLIPLDFPEYVNDGDDKGHAVRVTAMANYADVVLVNSEYTKDRFVNYCKVHFLRLPKTLVALIGIEEKFVENASVCNEKSLINGNYFITVSTIEPRKNHMLLLQIWREMAASGMRDIPRLVIVGKRGWSNSSTFSFLDRNPQIQPYVSEMSGLSDHHLIALMKGAKAMLFPSFVEGWGMPIVEAMALGLPIVCSDIPAFVESGQNIPKYKSPINGTAWKEEIIRLNTDEGYLRECRERVAQYVFPLWSEHFSVVRDVFDVVSENSNGAIPSSNILAFRKALETPVKKADNTDQEEQSARDEIMVTPPPSQPFSFRRLEDAWVRKFFSAKKHKKYCNNRRTFFEDSKSPFVKVYYRMTR
jgi:glycosyltransferase involved in cell wall biosynthesis